MTALNLTTVQLDLEIIDCNSDEEHNLIGASVGIHRTGDIKHAALFVRYNNQGNLLHFTGTEVLLDDADAHSHYYFRNIAFIPRELIPAFLTQCQLIAENAQPTYGYFYSGSSLYDETGDFKDPTGNPEAMTCVGFCLNVIKSFIGDDDFFYYTDWDHTTVPDSESYLNTFFKDVAITRPNLTFDEFKKQVRRIFPLEYFTGAFYDAVNVRKAFIDNNKDLIHGGLKKKRNI